jgi:hypothetical protein
VITEFKVIAGLTAIIAFFGALTLGYRAVYDAGRNAGETLIQTHWDADRQQIAQAAALSLAESTKRTEDALEANRVIHDTYEQRLADNAATALALAQRLRDAETRLAADRGHLSQAANQPGPAAAGASLSADTLTSALAAVFAEANANADALDALVAQINRQL